MIVRLTLRDVVVCTFLLLTIYTIVALRLPFALINHAHSNLVACQPPLEAASTSYLSHSRPQQLRDSHVLNDLTPSSPIQIAALSVWDARSKPCEDLVLPWYTNLFIETCHHNAPVVQYYLFVLVPDNVTSCSATASNTASSSVTSADASSWQLSVECRPSDLPFPSNFHIEYITATEFEDLLYRKLSVSDDAQYLQGYKLCDIKPMLGELLEEFIPEQQFSHWAWIDMDQLQGRWYPTVQMTDDVVAYYDILGFAPPKLPGQLTVLKNIEELRTLWRHHPQAYYTLRTPKYEMFDEMYFGQLLFDQSGLVLPRIYNISQQRVQLGDVAEYFYQIPMQYKYHKKTGLISMTLPPQWSYQGRTDQNGSWLIDTPAAWGQEHVVVRQADLRPTNTLLLHFYKFKHDIYEHQPMCQQLDDTWWSKSQAHHDEVAISLCQNTESLAFDWPGWPSHVCPPLAAVS